MKPMPHQLVARDYLMSQRRAYLGDEQGVGKTLPPILAAQAMWKRGLCQRVAVLCPAIGRSMWGRTFAEVTGWQGPMVESYERYVTNEDARLAIELYNPDLLILDEAHMLGRMTSQRTSGILTRSKGIVPHTPYVWAMSGTPLRSGIEGLFPLLVAMWPEELKALGITSYAAYLNRFTKWYESRKYVRKVVTEARNEEEFQRLLNRIMLRRTMIEVYPEMPPLSWELLLIDAEPVDTQQLYQDMRQEMRAEQYEELVAAIHYGELPDQFGGGMATARRLLGRAKAPYSAAIIKDELEAGQDKIFVSAYHTEVLDILEHELRDFYPVRIDGSTTPAQRESRMQEFQTNKGCRVLIGQIVATSTTITLHAANVCHQVEPLWVPDDNDQNARRIYRYGQNRPCIVKQHAMAGTLDEPLGGVLIRKQRTNATAMGEEITPVTKVEVPMK